MAPSSRFGGLSWPTSGRSQPKTRLDTTASARSDGQLARALAHVLRHDRHGWVNEAVPLSVRSITTVVAHRLVEGGRRSSSRGGIDLVGGPPNVQGAAPSGCRQRGARARQEARRRLEELEATIDAVDAYAEAVLGRLDLA